MPSAHVVTPWTRMGITRGDVPRIELAEYDLVAEADPQPPDDPAGPATLSRTWLRSPEELSRDLTDRRALFG